MSAIVPVVVPEGDTGAVPWTHIRLVGSLGTGPRLLRRSTGPGVRRCWGPRRGPQMSSSANRLGDDNDVRRGPRGLRTDWPPVGDFLHCKLVLSGKVYDVVSPMANFLFEIVVF